MEYPLELSSSPVGLDATITDASSHVILYSDGFSVFAGAQRTQPSYRVKIEKVMSLAPRYHLVDLEGQSVCTVTRDNVISFWKSWYDVLVNDKVIMRIREGKALGKTLGGLFDGTSLANIAARVWNPAFVVSRWAGPVLVFLEKRRSFAQSRFTIKRQSELNDDEERFVLLSLFGLLYFERSYG